MNAQPKIACSPLAKVMNEMGTPPNTPVVLHKFSLKFCKLCDALVLAQLRFLGAAFKYLPQGQDASVRKRRLVESRLDDVTKVIRRCHLLIGKSANRSDLDEHERDIVARFLIHQAVPFVEFWQETIEAIARGSSPEIKWRDIPVWFPENYKDPGGQIKLLSKATGHPVATTMEGRTSHKVRSPSDPSR